MRARSVAACMATTLSLSAPLANADESISAQEASSTQEEATPPVGQIDLTKDTSEAADTVVDPSSEAPKAQPYKKTLVLDASIGTMGFLGEFGKVAPPGPWMHLQIGYELLKWLMLYGEGELAFTDTSNRFDPPNVRAFPIYGFGGGARFTVRFSDRLGAYAQGSLGALGAHIATNALGMLGFRNAESLGLSVGARLGVEWYQINRHFALGLNAGIRTAQGFARLSAGTDSPLALDGGLSLRYAF